MMGLSYASYLVFPRTLLQSMPKDWQQRFTDLCEEYEEVMEDHLPKHDYLVKARDSKGKFIKDPLGNYQRGRRNVLTGNFDHE